MTDLVYAAAELDGLCDSTDFIMRLVNLLICALYRLKIWLIEHDDPLSFGRSYPSTIEVRELLVGSK